MPVPQPVLPAVSDFPNEKYFEEELKTAYELFKQELSSSEGWEDQGEREGVELLRKPNPDDPYAVPIVKGTCVVPNCTSDKFLACIQLPGMRKRWDARFEGGHMLARHSRHQFEFYTVMKGMGWLVYSRDIVGIQKSYRSEELNKEIILIQTSVQDDVAPDQSGKTRATLDLSGWQLLPQGDDLKVTYIVRIALNGSMPLQMVNMVATETPLCTGRARDCYENVGFAPSAHIGQGQSDKGIIWHTEQFSDPGVAQGDLGALEYQCKFNTASGATFSFLYDSKKMYAGGIQASVDVESVELKDDGEGELVVTCKSDGDLATVTIAPK